MHGRKRRTGALLGLLLFIAFVLGIVQIPTRAAFAGDGLGTAVVTMLLVLAIIIAALSGAIASVRQMGRDPSTRTATAVMGTAVSAMIGVGFIALVLLAILR